MVKRKHAAAYRSVVCVVHVLPVQVLFIGFVWEVSDVAHLFLFKLSHKCRVQFGEEFAVFNQRCFTATAICGFFQAKKRKAVGEERVGKNELKAG